MKSDSPRMGIFAVVRAQATDATTLGITLQRTSVRRVERSDQLSRTEVVNRESNAELGPERSVLKLHLEELETVIARLRVVQRCVGVAQQRCSVASVIRRYGNTYLCRNA
jgi:hypothetical protein